MRHDVGSVEMDEAARDGGRPDRLVALVRNDIRCFGLGLLVAGWSSSEQHPSRGYQRLLIERLAGVSAALDIQTGGGEVLAGIANFPAVMVATESWPPNAIVATQRLHPRGVAVVVNRDEPPLPFAEAAFDLVSSRHPDTETAAAQAAGLKIIQARMERLRVEFRSHQTLHLSELVDLESEDHLNGSTQQSLPFSRQVLSILVS